jgi:hypothetical protein
MYDMHICTYKFEILLYSRVLYVIFGGKLSILLSGSSNGHSPVLNLSKSGGGSGGEHSGSEAGHTGPEDDEDDENVTDADEEDEKDQGRER